MKCHPHTLGTGQLSIRINCWFIALLRAKKKKGNVTDMQCLVWRKQLPSVGK